jgi:hypothetical protein
VGAWDNQIIGEMRGSTPFEMTPSDEQFLENICCVAATESHHGKVTAVS